MRILKMKLSFLNIILLLGVMPSVALALPPPKDVTVVNNNDSPVPVNMQSASEYRIVGYTTHTTNGHIFHSNGTQGYFAMHSYCQAEVDANSRACFASEVSGPPLVTGTDFAWVIRSRDVAVIENTLDAGNNEFVAIDAGSGRVVYEDLTLFGAVGNLDCVQYTNSDSNTAGQVVTQISGSITVGVCNEVRQIACCAPVTIPVITP
jgi:hypothetical protein